MFCSQRSFQCVPIIDGLIDFWSSQVVVPVDLDVPGVIESEHVDDIAVTSFYQ
jgi:hypothetical protein